jgi:hypothetical protein
MGQCCAGASIIGESHSIDSNTSRWRIRLSKESLRQAYIEDGTIPVDASSSLVSFREILEDPYMVRKFAEYVQNSGHAAMLDYLVCWLDVLEFKAIDPGNPYKISKANLIFRKYFSECPAVFLPALAESQKISQVYKCCVRNAIMSNTVPCDIFDEMGHVCLGFLHSSIYNKGFRSTVKSDRRFNHVTVDDFEYIDYLGEGSFGLVVHCRKKSTGKYYAMKIQTKADLLRYQSSGGIAKAVNTERDALIQCQHPFIVGIDYAIQTPHFAILVTPFGSRQTLATLGAVSETSMVFYAAEIVLALCHIHSLGMIYRDLKPANILLNADGYILLLDMGSVGGNLVDDDVQSMSSDDIDTSHSAAGVLADARKRASYLQSASVKSDSNEYTSCPTNVYNSLKRVNSVVGTEGFMAPEVCAQ